MGTSSCVVLRKSSLLSFAPLDSGGVLRYVGHPVMLLLSSAALGGAGSIEDGRRNFQKWVLLL